LKLDDSILSFPFPKGRTMILSRGEATSNGADACAGTISLPALSRFYFSVISCIIDQKAVGEDKPF